jgi:hypothetical protein
MATRTRKPLTKAQKLTAWWTAHRERIAATWPFAALGLWAFYVSFGHIMYVTGQHINPAHNLPGVPLLMPLIVDVLMIACARAARKARTVSARLVAIGGFMAGLAVSLACNMLASDPGFINRGVSTWPAVALLIVALVFEVGGHKPLSPAQILRKVTDRAARKAARKGERLAPANLPTSPPVAWTPAHANGNAPVRDLAGFEYAPYTGQ